jgi:L-ribulose-5-phosphate 3-epimerase
MNRRDLLKTVPAMGAAFALPSLSAQADARKGRFRTAICAYSFRDALKAKTLTYEDLVRMCVDLDVDGIDMTVYWFPNTSDEFLLPLRRLAYKSAVAIYSVAVATEMTQPTPELQAREIEKLKKWIDVGEKLGAGHVRVFGGRVPKTATEDQAAGWVIEVLKRASDYAGSKGIILGLENHGGITEKADRILQIVKAVDSPWVGVNLDTGNFNRDSYAQMEKCIPYAANFQMKLEVRDAAGKKEPSDWDRIVGMAAKAGYKGYLALEYEEPTDPFKTVPGLMKKMREVTRKYSA